VRDLTRLLSGEEDAIRRMELSTLILPLSPAVVIARSHHWWQSLRSTRITTRRINLMLPILPRQMRRIMVHRCMMLAEALTMVEAPLEALIAMLLLHHLRILMINATTDIMLRNILPSLLTRSNTPTMDTPQVATTNTTHPMPSTAAVITRTRTMSTTATIITMTPTPSLRMARATRIPV
jgi:hypothetical protein